MSGFESYEGGKGVCRNTSSDGGNNDQQRRDVDGRDRNGGQGPIEVYPVGLFDKAPAVDDPIYYDARAGADGKPASVGPFELTANHFRTWANKQTSNDLDDLIERGQLRASTVLTLKSQQFGSILSLMDSGQKLPPSTVQRFLPGDLQRVVYSKFCEGQPRSRQP